MRKCGRSAIGILCLIACGQGYGPSLSDKQLDALSPVPTLDASRASDEVWQAMMEVLTSIDALRTAEHVGGQQLADGYAHLGQMAMAYDFDKIALVCLKNAARLEPDEARWVYLRAHLLNRLGQVEDSFRAYAHCLEQRPDYLPARMAIVDLLMEDSRLEEAQGRLDHLGETDATHPATLFRQGRLAQRRGDHQRAVPFYERILQQDPSAEEVHYPLGLAYRALGQARLARYHLAQRGSRRVTLEDPWMEEATRLAVGARALNQRGDYAMIEGQAAAAAVSYAAAVATEPNNVEFRVDLAATLIELGRHGQAASHLDTALNLDPTDPAAHFNHAMLLVHHGQDAEAYGHLLRVLESNPGHVKASLNAGSCALRLDRLGPAERHFTAVLSAAPLSLGAHVGRGLTLMRLGRWATARQALETSITVLPRAVEPMTLMVRLLSACPVDSVRDGPRAMRLARRLVAGDRSVETIQAQAMALAEVGRFDAAVRLQTDAIDAVRSAGFFDRVASMAALLEQYRAARPSRRPLER